jgi:VanZ family protein
MQSRTIWLALWVAMSAALSVLYLLPDTGPSGNAQIDKVAHLAAFSAIGGATWPATQRWKAFSLLLLIGCLLGIGLECLQAVVPGRYFSEFDILANMVGIAVGAAAGRRFDDVLARLVKLRRSR